MIKIVGVIVFVGFILFLWLRRNRRGEVELKTREEEGRSMFEAIKDDLVGC